MATSSPHALLSGGGSGGHVFPGLAVAAELEERGWRVSWLGSEKGLEADLVRRRGVTFHSLPARPLVGRGAWGKIRALFTTASSALAARALVRREGVQVVLGTGGYASAAGVLGARFAGRPVLLLEPNAEVGFANRQLSRFANEATVAHDITATGLCCSTTTTGVPVRSEFFQVSEDLREAPPFRLLVLGGSQGARRLNEALPAALANLGLPVHVVHQAGRGHTEATEAAYAGAHLDAETVQVDVVPFLDDMAAAMAASHLVISRAGAITLAEICAAGRPALLLPLYLAAGHQVGNARRLEEAGAAAVLEDNQLVERLPTLLAELLGSLEALRTMAAKARSLGRPDAAKDIADRVEHLAGRAA